eukprot:COSAG02_NODE_983_length_15470_cov_4.269924_8_plen_79_part_00
MARVPRGGALVLCLACTQCAVLHLDLTGWHCNRTDSAFTIRSAKWAAGTNADPHVIEIQAAPDNKAAREDLDLAPWSQ